MDRKTTFVLALVYLIVILALGLVFFVSPRLLSFLPSTFGPVPLGVPWFGALGAVLISLTGVFEHEHDWDSSYWPWHVARPLVGVALGVVSVLILQAGVLAVGSTPTQSPKIPTNLLYYLVAFLVGYREETFRELIKRLVDVILTPGNGSGSGTAPTIHAPVNPPQAVHGTATQVVITGSGFASTQSVKFGNLPAAQFTINQDGTLTATTPALATAGVVPLTVTTKGGSASINFTFS